MDFEETLTENQKAIYNIAKEYLRTHPHFTVEELFTVCRRKSNLTVEEISSILLKFIRKKIFVPGSRLTRETLLENQRRSEIYQYISSNPGLNFNQIINHFQIGARVGYMHLALLKKFGFIRQRKYKVFNLYFHSDFPGEKEILIHLLRNPNILNIYQCLKYHPLNSNALAKILGLHYSTIQYHLSHLQQQEMIIEDDGIFDINLIYLDFLEDYYELTISSELKSQIDEYLKQKKFAPLQEKNKGKLLI